MSLWTPDGEHEVNKEQPQVHEQSVHESQDINDVPGF